MLHIGPCERKIVIGDNEYGDICREWRRFKEIMNLIMKKDDEGEDFESNDEKDDENKIEIEEIEDEVVEMVQDLPNQPDPSADHSSYDDKTGLESVNNSTYVDKSSIESVETVSDDDESRLKTIREETNEFMNEISTKEKYVTEILKFVGEIPERDKKIIRKQDKIRDEITKESHLEKNSVNQKFEWPNLKEIKNFHNTILERDNKKDKTLNPNTNIYIRKKRYIMAFYVPKFTIYIHSNTKRILEVKNLYH